MADPIHISAERERSALEGIKQFLVVVEEEWKFETFRDLFGVLMNTKVVILCNTGEKVSCSLFQIASPPPPLSKPFH